MKDTHGWTRGLPLVQSAVSDTPKPITVVYPYYRCPVFFTRQLGWWAGLPDDLQEALSFIVVDDGSPVDTAESVFAQVDFGPRHIRLFRIQEDRRWNWLAARNIGFHHAAPGWVLVTDMDHMVPVETFRRLVYGAHDERAIYAFSRLEHTGQEIAPHPNSWFMTREMFWRVGGYDEALSGHYGTDGEWRRRCAKTATMAVLTDALVRHEYQADSSTTHYQRKQPEDKAVSKIVAKRRPGWTPKTLSFPYYEVGA